jgi:outer membrane protein TolC
MARTTLFSSFSASDGPLNAGMSAGLRVVLRPIFALIPILALTLSVAAQTPPVITLQDALARARQYGTQIQSANLNAQLAKEDRAQAKAATLPSVNAFNQFIYTEGNGTPSGVFVANDGVHIYNEQAQVHEELLSLVRHGEIRRAMAAEAVAKAKIEVAQRGLTATVVQDYYAIVSAQRKFANAQSSLREADQFLDISQKQEKGGEVARADVIKAQITQQQRQRDLQDAQLNIEKARIALGVLIFPDFRSDFAVDDDLQQPVLLPPFPEAQAKATATSPDLRVAKATIEQAGYDVTVARYAYLPSFGLDFFYGIDANQFAARASNVEDTGRSTLPNFTVANRQNLGYSAQATLNIPVWNWGATRSKIKQAALKQQQAELDLTLAQRTLQGNVASAYREAQTAQSQVDSLRSSSDLSAESLRLTLLRYQAGEANALEVVDAQTTLAQARNAYDDGLVRYRVAIANLQTLTGN